MKGSLQHNLVAFTALVWMALPDPLCMQHCNPLSILTNSGHLIWDPTSQPQALLPLFLTFRFSLWSPYLRTHPKKPHSLPTQHQPPTISASRSLKLVFPQKHEQEWSNRVEWGMRPSEFHLEVVSPQRAHPRPECV